MANSAKKINMNKKQLQKSLEKMATSDSKKKNSGQKTNNQNKNKNNVAKNNTVSVKTNKPVTNNTNVNKQNNTSTKKNTTKTTKTTTKKTPAVQNKPKEKEVIVPVEVKKVEEPFKKIETKEKKPLDLKSVFKKNEKDNKQKNKKKKIDKKDVFKVNKDGSIYDLNSIYPKKKIDKTKNKKTKQIDKNLENTSFRDSFLEDLTDVQLEERKQETKKSLKKLLIVVAILFVLGIVLFFGYKTYKSIIKETLMVYEEYSIGRQVKLKDNSVWYVVEYSDKGNSKVKLLSPTLLDLNNDGTVDENDKYVFSREVTTYDKKDQSGLAYFLDNTYKPILEEKIGPIEDIDMVTSKQFVRMRDFLGFGYEWNDPNNILASDNFGYWWINSESDKMYVVSPRGSYKMTSKDSLYYTRCVITLNKDDLPKEEKNEETDVNKENVEEK